MLDDPKKTAQLIAELKAAVPFEVDLTPRLISHLRTKNVDIASANARLVRDLSYAGDEGGIVCHLAGPDADWIHRVDEPGPTHLHEDRYRSAKPSSLHAQACRQILREA